MTQADVQKSEINIRAFPNTVLEAFFCACGKCIGEVDLHSPHTERKWCRTCKSWTVIVIREKE